MVAEIVGSAVVQETISQILSVLVQNKEEKEESNAKRNLERLEMAHIKLEAALKMSDKWHITDPSLLRWHKKLKGVVQECNDTLHNWKQRVLDKELMEEEVRNFSFPKRLAHATKSYIFSPFSHDNDELSKSIVRRFEWFADGAGEFLRFMELGGTPKRDMPLNPFVKHLVRFKNVPQKIDWGKNCPFSVLWFPSITAEHAIEASLVLVQNDGDAPENNFYFSVTVQLSDSTDIIGIAFKCLQLFNPLFSSTVETIRNKLMQLPTQDFSWVVPYVNSQQEEHLGNLLSFDSQWFRPNPLCCKHQNQLDLRHSSNMAGFPDVSLEAVVQVNLQCQVSLPASRGKTALQDSQHLVAGIAFMPHGSSEDLLPVHKNSAVLVIDGEKQHCLNTDITLEQQEEITLPMAVDHFSKNPGARVYQVLWRSKHGAAYIHVENERVKMQTTQKMVQGAKRRKISRKRGQELQSQLHFILHNLILWVPQVPFHLQGAVMNWIRKEEEDLLILPLLHVKF